MQLQLYAFIIRQLNQISTEGWPALRRKLQRLVLLPLELPFIFLAFFLVLLIRLIHTFVIVRIGSVDVGRIGGIYQGDWYLSEKADGLHLDQYLDFFWFAKSTGHVNRQWLQMWWHALPSVPGTKLWKHVLRLNRLFPGFEIHEIPKPHVYPDLKQWQAHLVDSSPGRMDIYNKRLNSVLKNRKANIAFSLEEEEMGRRALEDLGIPKEKQYICFHARDPVYLDTVYNKLNWSYHNYRDSNIQNYVLAAEEMAKRDYYAVRIGAIVRDSIHSSNPQVIDYATSGQRTDFNDIYIGSHCRFLLCSDGGISAIPEMFRIPVVYVNWTAILRISTWQLNGLFIFKKFFLKNQKRYMSFSEIMNLKFGGSDTYEMFDRLNLELIENTPEEICSVTVEMDERLNGTWKDSEKDEELQRRFWALFGPDKLRSPDLRIGAEYLRQNRNLLV